MSEVKIFCYVNVEKYGQPFLTVKNIEMENLALLRFFYFSRIRSKFVTKGQSYNFFLIILTVYLKDLDFSSQNFDQNISNFDFIMAKY